MNRLRLIGAWFAVVAIWAQIFVPMSAMAMERAVDPFSIICSHTPDGGQTPSKPGHHDHQHCLLCQASLVQAIVEARPAFTALDYPIASPLRWALCAVASRSVDPYRTAQPRGPPLTI